MLEQTKIVWPSGLLLAARSAAIAPLAPGLFSTTTGTPKMRLRPSAMLRAAWSVAEPGPNGTRMRIGPLGKLSARARLGAARVLVAAMRKRRVIMPDCIHARVRDERKTNMSVRAGREFLAIPGPTTVPDEVLRAMHRPAVDIYSGPLLALTDGLLRDIARVFNTTGPRLHLHRQRPRRLGSRAHQRAVARATRSWCWRAAASPSAGARARAAWASRSRS